MVAFVVPLAEAKEVCFLDHTCIGGKRPTEKVKFWNMMR